MEDPGLSKILEMIQELEERIKKLPDGTKIKATDDIDKCLHPEYNDLNKDKLERQILSLISLFQRMKKWDGQKLENGKKSIINEIVDIEDKLIKLEKYGIQNPRKNFIVRLKDEIDQPPVYEYPYSTNEHFDEWRQATIDYYVQKYGGNPLYKAWLKRPMNRCQESVLDPEKVEEVMFLLSDNTLKRMRVKEFKEYVMKHTRNLVKALILGESRYTGFQQITYNLQACESIEHIILYNGITSMGEDCLRNLKKLKKLVLPPSVRTIGDFAFENDTELQTIIFPEGVKWNRDGNVFYGTKFSQQNSGIKVFENNLMNMGKE